MHSINPIFCALDTIDIDRANELVHNLRGVIGGVKIGIEFFNAHGPQGCHKISESGMPIFLDLKLHDIPNTVANGIRAILPLKPAIINVHAAGGLTMMRAAAEAAKEARDIRPLVIAVTVLTSLDKSDLTDIGIMDLPIEHVLRLAHLATRAGLDGIVCSAHEVKYLRQEFGRSLKLIVPGIRPINTIANDHKRVLTPSQALTLGADILIIGRPITEATDPRATAEAILRASLTREYV